MIEKLEQELKETKAALLAAVEAAKKATGLEAKALADRVDALQRQADAIDIKMADRHGGGGGSGEAKSLATLLKEDEGMSRLARDGKGQTVFTLKGEDCRTLERKTTVDSAAVGRMTTGVLAIDRMSGITAEARETLRLRSLLASRPTSQQVIDFVKVNSPMTRASMQTESSAKVENAVTFTSASERVKTIASLLPASRQVLEDMADLASFINDSLMYYVDLAEETQFLTGSGTGEDLNGLVTQGTAFSSSLLPLTPGWQRIDVVSAIIQQIREAKEIPPDWIVLSPRDYFTVLRTKNSQGNYLAAGMDPWWGLTPVVTTVIGNGNFLVGSGNPEATVIRDRMEVQVEISTQHSDFFAKNLVMVRAEKRLALVTRRPASFIQGSFSQSPA